MPKDDQGIISHVDAVKADGRKWRKLTNVDRRWLLNQQASAKARMDTAARVTLGALKGRQQAGEVAADEAAKEESRRTMSNFAQELLATVPEEKREDAERLMAASIETNKATEAGLRQLAKIFEADEPEKPRRVRNAQEIEDDVTQFMEQVDILRASGVKLSDKVVKEGAEAVRARGGSAGSALSMINRAGVQKRHDESAAKSIKDRDDKLREDERAELESLQKQVTDALKGQEVDDVVDGAESVDRAGVSVGKARRLLKEADLSLSHARVLFYYASDKLSDAEKRELIEKYGAALAGDA